jgi:uncharacterized protein YbjT (DUF2867 family)
MRTAIIGAYGQIGRILSSSLQDSGHELLLCSRRPVPEENSIVFDPLKDDWSVLGKLDVIINSAGIIRESRAEDFYKVHLDLVKTMIANRHKTGNPKIIQISALGADSSNSIPFLRTKGMADDILLSNPDTYIIRPSIVSTPNTLLIQKLKWLVQMSRILFHRPVVPTGFLETRVQPVMPEDLQEAVSTISTTETWNSRIIDCVGPDKFSFKELLDMSGKIVPIEIPKKLIEPVTRNFVAVWFPDLINSDQFQLLFKDNTADTSGIEALIGHSVRSSRHFWAAEMKN